MLMGHFSSGEDILYLKKGKDGHSPFEYFYLHVNDEEGANFCAYFDNLSSDNPVVYQMIKVESNSPVFMKDKQKNVLDEADILSNEDNKEQKWEKVHTKVNMIVECWCVKLDQIRNEIIKQLRSSSMSNNYRFNDKIKLNK